MTCMQVRFSRHVFYASQKCGHRIGIEGSSRSYSCWCPGVCSDSTLKPWSSNSIFHFMNYPISLVINQPPLILVNSQFMLLKTKRMLHNEAWIYQKSHWKKSMRFLNYVIDNRHKSTCLKSAFRKQYRWIEWTFTGSWITQSCLRGIAVMGALL